MTFAVPTIISCKYYSIIFCFCDGALWKYLYKMAASLKDKRTPITTPPYQVPSVDVTPDPPIFLLVTTFNDCHRSVFYGHILLNFSSKYW